MAHLRRKVGIQGIQRDESAKAGFSYKLHEMLIFQSNFKKVGSEIASLEMAMVNDNLAQFRVRSLVTSDYLR